MRVKYIGSRDSLVTTGINRKEYYFGKENGYIVDVETEQEATKLLKSPLHKFAILPDVKPEEVLIPDTPKEQTEYQKIAEKPAKLKEFKKKGKKK